MCIHASIAVFASYATSAKPTIGTIHTVLAVLNFVATNTIKRIGTKLAFINVIIIKAIFASSYECSVLAVFIVI